MNRKCNKCNSIKFTSDFSGNRNTCKPCVCISNRDYWRTPKGRISQIYTTQVSSSKQRKHPLPAYSKPELLTWAYANNLMGLIEQWKLSNYDKNLIPSVDRLNPNLPYTLDNIRLVTWQTNNEKAYQDRKTCKHITSQNRKIEQLSPAGEHIAYFDSIAMASRATGITRTNINGMCKNKPYVKSVGGYIWKYAS